MGVIEVPAEVGSLLESGAAGWLATTNESGLPETTRVMGADVGPKRRSITLYVPLDQAGMTFDNLRKSDRLAVIFVKVTNYRAMQMKGDLISMREGNESDRPRVERYTRDFADDCVKVGLTRELILSLRDWPAMVVEMSVNAIFLQSPGPEAGTPWR